MAYRVTFDSNVLGDILKSNQIKNAISQGEIIPCAAETVFTYDSIHKNDRLPWLKGKITPELLKQGTLRKVMDLDFKVLRCPRIGTLKYASIPEQYYYQDTDISRRQQAFGRCQLCIEDDLHCGIYCLKEIGRQHLSEKEREQIPCPWRAGLHDVNENELKKVWKAVAEWADGDSIAAHIAYENDFYCTRDKASNAGIHSIFHNTNLKKLKEKYQIEVLSPEELLSRI